MCGLWLLEKASVKPLSQKGHQGSKLDNAVKDCEGSWGLPGVSAEQCAVNRL